MDKKELLSLIRVKMENTAQQYNFKQYATSQGSGGFVKKTKDINFYCSYVVDSWVDEHNVFGFSKYVGYPPLENIATTVLEDNGLVGKGAVKMCISYSPEYKRIFEYPERIIMTEELLQPFIKSFKRYFVEEALPFFDKFSDLNKFYHLLVKGEDDKDKLKASFGSLHYEYKLLTVYRLCNDELYESMMEKQYSDYKRVSEKYPEDIDFQRMYGAYRDLKAILDKTVPIYNI